MDRIRLDKFLSSQLNISRSQAKEMLRAGRVTLNGAVCKKPETQVEADADRVFADGTQVRYQKYVYIALNKPAGVVSASVSPGDTTVIDLLPEDLRRAGLFPAGRLDKDSTGFVLITDDGAFAHRLLSPAHHVNKQYVVTLARPVSPEELDALSQGIRVGSEAFRPAAVAALSGQAGEYTYGVTLTEGRYHEIKRMFAYFGNRVLTLHRTRIGGLALPPELRPGESRLLTPAEVDLLTQ